MAQEIAWNAARIAIECYTLYGRENVTDATSMVEIVTSNGYRFQAPKEGFDKWIQLVAERQGIDKKELLAGFEEWQRICKGHRGRA